MKTKYTGLLVAAGLMLLLVSCRKKPVTSVTVPFVLDHNRMLVEAEIQRKDGSWRKARLWVDTGNPYFVITETLARDLGIDLADSGEYLEVPPPAGVRIGGMQLDFDGVNSVARTEPYWLFAAMHHDGNLPSTVLKKYHVVFDYPQKRLTIAGPGTHKSRGTRASAHIHPQTGIPQIDAVVSGDSMSFALDNGASFSFISHDAFESLLRKLPDNPTVTGTAGCANMWGWWPPNEQASPVTRLPEIWWGPVRLTDVAIVGVPVAFENGPGLGEWYSHKTARPVVGFLGPNAFKSFRIEIDYENRAIYFEKGKSANPNDMDLAGLTLRPELDGTYTVIGVPAKDGKPVVPHVEPGDLLVGVDDLETKGKTLGTVVDALRGQPGDVRVLEVERNGERFKVEASVERLL